MKVITKILIIGGGRIGTALAHRLPGATLVEADPAKVILLRQELDNVAVVHGDARNRETLIHAGIQDVDEVFIATNRDKINLDCAVIAKEFNVPRIIARVNKTETMDSFFAKDIEVVPWRAEMGTEMVDTFLHPDTHHVAEVVICSHAKAIGRKLAELKLPEGSLIAAVLRGDHLVAPTDGLEIQKGDVLSVHSTKRDVHDVIELITGGKKGLAPFNHILVPLFKPGDITAFREAAVIAKAADARLITVSHPEDMELITKAKGLVDMHVKLKKTIGTGSVIELIDNVSHHLAEIDQEKKELLDLSAIEGWSTHWTPPGDENGDAHSNGAATGTDYGEDWYSLLDENPDLLIDAIPTFDCIAISPETLTFRQWLFRYSTVTELLHRSHCPILVTRNPRPYRRILVMIDGYPHSDTIASYTLRIAQLFDATIEVQTIYSENPEEVKRLMTFLKRAGKIHNVTVIEDEITSHPATAMIQRVKSGVCDLTLLKWGCPLIKRNIIKIMIHKASISILVFP